MSILKTKELQKLGYSSNQINSLVISTLNKYYKHSTKSEIISILENIKEKPDTFLTDIIWMQTAEKLCGKIAESGVQSFELRTEKQDFKIYSAAGIDTSAINQMELAMKLPVSVLGALMPDAHAGYGLPIGAVLAADNAVIPYGVGMDIGCRMALSIVSESSKFLKRYNHQIQTAFNRFTDFGMDGGLAVMPDHEVMDSDLFNETLLLKKLKGKAAKQLGSSGSGNHFVEFGEVELFENNITGLPAGNYIGLLSHSGSRGLGASIAGHYSQAAMNSCKLPREAQHLAWLNLNSEAGQEYWLSMTLAGDYAKACHDCIHHSLLKALGLKPVLKIENHHNFAWKEKLQNGIEAVIHRKGASPAHKNELGIIPGNMIAPAYIVSGKGAIESLNSASHGAGRIGSRKEARESITNSALQKMLKEADVTLIGGNLDESPRAYKNIDEVMDAQKPLITVQGKFLPRIVKMNKD